MPSPNYLAFIVSQRSYGWIDFEPSAAQRKENTKTDHQSGILIFSNIWNWYFRTCQFGIFHTRLIYAHSKVVTKLWYAFISNWYAFISNWYAFISNWYTFISDWYVCNINFNQFCFYFFASYKQINIENP